MGEENFGVELISIIGYQNNDYTNLKNRLNTLSGLKISEDVFQIGVGLSFRFRKLIIGYDMSVLPGDAASGFYLHVFVSTNIIKLKKVIISPQIGIGNQTNSFRVSSNETGPNFDSYFTNSANKVELTHSNEVIDYGIAFKLYGRNGNPGYVPLMRIGYRQGLKEKPWKITRGNSTNAPIDRNSNFYLQLILGFGD